MRRTKEASAVYTAKSGKPGARIKTEGTGNTWEFHTFTDVDEVRDLMGEASKTLEQEENTNRVKSCPPNPP